MQAIRLSMCVLFFLFPALLSACEGGIESGVAFAPGDTAELDPALNLLPYECGTSHAVTQAHGGLSHNGDEYWAWDFGMPMDTPVLAAHYGTVRLVQNGFAAVGCGNSSCANDVNFVVLDAGNGFETLYLHLSRATVSEGQSIARGDVLGYSGASGWSTAPHLHFHTQAAGGSWYKPTVRDVFMDGGVAFDPQVGTSPVSANCGG